MDSNNTPEISIVVPVYGCCACLEVLCKRLEISLGNISNDYEIILINDSSPDHSWETMISLSKGNQKIKSINLSRRFGQHHAITAGLDLALGNWVVVMDCDLQDAPEEIPNMYHKSKEGYDLVLAKRTLRQDRFFRVLSSKIFYYVFNKFVGIPSDYDISNFGIYSKKVIDSIRSMKEQNRFFPLFVNWCGYKRGIIEVQHNVRPNGKSSYNVSRLLQLAINTIISYSNKPLVISIQFGIVVSFLSLLVGILLVVKKVVWGVTISGWTSLMVSLFFMFGALFAHLGILGLYLGKIFNEVKGRPLYLIQEKINL